MKNNKFYIQYKEDSGLSKKEEVTVGRIIYALEGNFKSIDMAFDNLIDNGKIETPYAVITTYKRDETPQERGARVCKDLTAKLFS